MKKLPLISLYFLLFFVAGCLTQPNKPENIPPTVADNAATFQKGFVLSEEFIKADDETMLSLIAESLGLQKKLSAKQKSEYLIEYKKTTEVYVKENSNNKENIVIHKFPYVSSIFLSNQEQKFLDETIQQIDIKAEDYLANGIEFKLIGSGLGKYRDRFEYIWFEEQFKFDGVERYSNQYLISVNNQGYQIVINTLEGLRINDVFTEIN